MLIKISQYDIRIFLCTDIVSIQRHQISIWLHLRETARVFINQHNSRGRTWVPAGSILVIFTDHRLLNNLILQQKKSNCYKIITLSYWTKQILTKIIFADIICSLKKGNKIQYFSLLCLAFCKRLKLCVESHLYV